MDALTNLSNLRQSINILLSLAFNMPVTTRDKSYTSTIILKEKKKTSLTSGNTSQQDSCQTFTITFNKVPEENRPTKQDKFRKDFSTLLNMEKGTKSLVSITAKHFIR